MPTKSSLLSVAILLITAFACFSSPALAMQELGDVEMSRISAGQHLVFNRVETDPLPIEDPPGYRPAYDMYTLVAPFYKLGEPDAGLFHGAVTRTPQVTVKDLNGKLWALEKAIYEKTPINLWLVINTFKVPRGYFDDMGLERYGWELADADFSKVVRSMFNDMNLTWVSDYNIMKLTWMNEKPLRVDNVVHQIIYNPIPRHEWVAVREETYYPDGSVHGLKSVLRREECHYWRGYWVVLSH